MFDIVATDSAERDLREIRDYLLAKLCSPQAWDNLCDKIDVAYRSLRNQPLLFPECRDSRLRMMGYHMCSLGAYLFVYRVDASASQVRVIRFFHELQEYEAQL